MGTLHIKYIEKFITPIEGKVFEINEEIEGSKIRNGRIYFRDRHAEYLNGILPDGHPFSCGDYTLFSELSGDNQKKAHDWVEKYCIRMKTYNRQRTSYGLKHILDKAVKVYMSNNQFKDLMLLHGFKPENKFDLNWCFQIQERPLKNLIKELRI